MAPLLKSDVVPLLQRGAHARVNSLDRNYFKIRILTELHGTLASHYREIVASSFSLKVLNLSNKLRQDLTGLGDLFQFLSKIKVTLPFSSHFSFSLYDSEGNNILLKLNICFLSLNALLIWRNQSFPTK